MTVTMKTIPDIINALKKRKPSALSKNSDKPLSSKEAVMQLATILLAKKEEGFTSAELVDFLAEHGIAVKAHNLTRYLREHGSPAAKSKSEPARQSAQVTALILEPESPTVESPKCPSEASRTAKLSGFQVKPGQIDQS